VTSVDSNVIFAALTPHETHHERARQLLREANPQGLRLSPVVYAELMASSEREALKEFLERAGLEVLWEMPAAVWERAGVAFGDYARARRGGRLPRRLIADFLIAAHAEHHGLSVLSFDDTVYRAVFPGLRVMT
jgi:predicted nucleic acid-binding protein